MGKILVPIDASPNSARGLDKAIELARNDTSSITLLHVVTLPPVYVVGHPYDIEQFARKYKHDMIVIGAKGKSTLNRLFLDSVSGYLIQIAKTPVMVIK